MGSGSAVGEWPNCSAVAQESSWSMSTAYDGRQCSRSRACAGGVRRSGWAERW